MALMDIRGSLTPVVASALASDDETADRIVSIWRAKQMDRAAISNSLGLGHTSFRDCTRQGLDYALARSRFELPKVERESLVRAWDDLRPWPEAVEVVESIKLRGYKTAILSNGDQDMLEAAARNFGSNIDHILSAEMAGAYKPSPKVSNFQHINSTFPPMRRFMSPVALTTCLELKYQASDVFGQTEKMIRFLTRPTRRLGRLKTYEESWI